ncbi:hypothetical protein EV643_1384 [Kribbella sp. VKM Ac-2527]|uniref:Uncharacterized protein n=1 Tax=Kribbella caucasensis TaxID=2512215 RepID=A0A4R6J6B9_9ACTN|nr:hypothetical protein EV643_1384 [Kribbella sp. VKM Ac-2527]
MGGEPADDNGAGAAQHLAEQPPGAVEVDEAGMPSIHQHPLAGGRVLFPARLAAAGLIDAEHPGRRRRSELAIGDLDQRGMRGRPRHPERRRDLTDRPVRVPDRHRDRLPQPPGSPRTRRQLTDRLGEAQPLAQRLPAPPPALVPHHRDRPCPVRDVARRGDHVALHRRRHQPTRRTARSCLVSGVDMDFPDAARQQHDTLHAHARQPEQHAKPRCRPNAAEPPMDRSAMARTDARPGASLA